MLIMANMMKKTAKMMKLMRMMKRMKMMHENLWMLCGGKLLHMKSHFATHVEQTCPT